MITTSKPVFLSVDVYRSSAKGSRNANAAALRSICRSSSVSCVSGKATLVALSQVREAVFGMPDRESSDDRKLFFFRRHKFGFNVSNCKDFDIL